MEKQINKLKYRTEEQQEMLHFVIVLLIIVGIVLVVYFASKVFVMDKSLFQVAYQDGKINSERAIVGTIFNRPNKEYYVLLYPESISKAVYYSSLSTNYTSKQENALPLYHVDLDNELNKKYYVGSDGESNPKAKNVSELKFKTLTLIKIKNGKIDKYLEKEEDIQKELAVTKKKNS
ncbi:MAG: hypothetical protein HFH86_03680 [Bacilli bacterium]|jgi:hypothetical protein|nr:hypothetical protein [Bacilli bacterium]